MAGVELRAMHPLFESAFNDHDLDRAMQLYAPDSTMLLQDGTELHGADAIRSSLEAMFGVPGRMEFRTRYVVESGDLAVLSGEWTLETDDGTLSAVTAEVARRDADGGWHYVIDHPYSSLDSARTANVISQLEDPNLGIIRNVARR